MKTLREYIGNIKDPGLKKNILNIVDGKIVKQVKCLSEDVYGDVVFEILDKKGNPVLETKGENKGKPKTEIRNVVVKEGCNGRVVAHIYQDGRVQGVVNENKEMYLRAFRQRMDGYMGFECWCGNDSRLAEQEKGHMSTKGYEPSKEDILEIFEKINKQPSNYREENGSVQVDGFLIEAL